MKVDAPLYSFDAPEEEVRRLEAKGYAGAFTYEGPHDPFFPLLLAARASQKIDLYTAVAIGFARNPMILANIGWDLQALSKGRFLLGLGTQIKPHIEKRFGMPWSKPAARMREMVLAIKEIWRCWETNERLDYRGEVYQHTLMTPMFNPGQAEFGLPPIFLAGVGPRMTEVCGEVADGFFVHPFSTAKSFGELTLPALDRGLEAVGRAASALEISLQVMVCTGADDEEIEHSREATKTQVAFYGSTPAYRPVLECHGWGDLQPELNAMTKQGKWGEMNALISDELLEEIAVCAPIGEVAERVRERCQARADRVSLVAHWTRDPDMWDDVIRDLGVG
ncbi:MAG: TIGR03617 family F420-dependent LLM class oxidoreductase [bacterium]|nr:LLM class F420-dependent oxidoreductase [Deltaproteobacteria bacterium]MCP4905213.1 TIGR03617 family F420-dependent LLM class oxidoreductase [bacterium]